MDKRVEKLLKLLNRETYGFPHDKIIYDKDGVPLKVGVFDGRLVSPFGQKSFEKIRDLTLRDDDVFLVGYPKTGCHWTHEILTMIVEGKGQLSETGKMSYFLEATSLDTLEKHSSRTVMNTHLWFDALPKQTKEKKTKIVFTVRNPKDTAVSFYNHHISLYKRQGYNGPFSSWFPLFMDGQVDYGSYFDFHKEWDEAIKNNPSQPIIVVWYEDLKEDLPREIRKLSKFLDVSLSDKQVEEIAKAAGFETMRETYKNTDNVSTKMLRSGQVGDWKNWLTVAQSETVDAAVKDKLDGTVFGSPRYFL